MLFKNNEVNIQDLPKVEEIQYNQLNKKYKYVIMLNWLIPFIFLYLASYLISLIPDLPVGNLFIIISFSALTAFLISRFVIIHLGFPLKGYCLREHDIIYRSGLINKKIIAIPYNRIQHSEIRQSMIARMFKLSLLKIFTAGGSKSDLSIGGLSPEKAEEIKDFLSKTISHHE